VAAGGGSAGLDRAVNYLIQPDDRFKWLVESLQERLDFFTLHTYPPSPLAPTAPPPSTITPLPRFLQTSVARRRENVTAVVESKVFGV